MFPYLHVRILIRGWETEALALIETGFSGDLVIPADALPGEVGESDYVRAYRVADDRVMHANMFSGDVVIPGLPPISGSAIGLLGSRYIIGLGLIEQYVVTLERGERVIVEP